MPAISVLLPLRNAAHTVDGAITNIIAQTFTDRGLLLIDNTSTDEYTTIATSSADSVG